MGKIALLIVLLLPSCGTLQGIDTAVEKATEVLDTTNNMALDLEETTESLKELVLSLISTIEDLWSRADVDGTGGLSIWEILLLIITGQIALEGGKFITRRRKSGQGHARPSNKI